MSDLFRSEHMRYVQINASRDFATQVVRAMGKHGHFHVVDLSEVASADDGAISKVHKELKRKIVECSAWETRLGYLEAQMVAFDIEVPSVFIGVEEHADVIESVAAYVTPREAALKRDITFREQTTAEINSLIERSWVLRVCQSELSLRLMEFDRRELESQANTRMDIEMQAQPSPRFHRVICGTIPVAHQNLFERMVFRISRGNAMTAFNPLDEPLDDPASNEPVLKAVFYVVCVGQSVYDKVEKVTHFFNATVYDIPESTAAFNEELDRIRIEVDERREVVERTRLQIVATLKQIAGSFAEGSSPLRDWQMALKREKAINAFLRKCHFYVTMFTIEGWVPVKHLPSLKTVLAPHVNSGAAAYNIDPENTLVEQRSPPTYFETNKVTESFQAIVDTYGVPRYREVNPGLFTIVTFPFLFGVMYGDVGHGLAMVLFALYWVWKEKHFAAKQAVGELGELPSMAFGGRYLLLFMGLFAVYCGFIYNDCLSNPLPLFESSYFFEHGDTVATVTSDSPYPFGVDPAWYHTDNELPYFNSLKMKLSVIIGVVHMTFGIMLSLLNHLHTGDHVSIIFEFVPQLVFFLFTFGYMILLILIKWCTEWPDPSLAPSLIQTMIGMFLRPGDVEPQDELYTGQAGVQAFLLVVALLCVPVMLFAKPLIARAQHRARHSRVSGGRAYEPLSVNSFDESDELHSDEEPRGAAGRGQPSGKAKKKKKQNGGGGHGHGNEPYSFMNDMIHQGIHTIEFVLGAVSNTASYLRLWALSLAHAELSDVFWEKLIMEYGVATGNPFFIFVGFGAWAGATFAVLLCMDVLECFLHALRLHWVEFQNKFFNADGYQFAPFRFEVSIGASRINS